MKYVVSAHFTRPSGSFVLAMHYNFCRIHKSLRITPAMAAGVTNKLWEIEDIISLLTIYN
jgi:hypothetical protein